MREILGAMTIATNRLFTHTHLSGFERIANTPELVVKDSTV